MKECYIDMHCHILPGVDDGAKDLAETKKMLEIAYAEVVTLNFDAYDNMYDLLLSKINDPRTSVNESGKMYKSFEEAVEHYKNYKKENIASTSSEEMATLCSLMDFVYLGRVAKSEIQN